MPLPRVNLFKMIHTAIRGQLNALTTAAGKANYTDFRQVEALHTSTLSINSFLKAHAEREDKYVQPALKEKKFPGIDALHQEHAVSDEKLQELVSDITDFKENHATLAAEIQASRGYKFYLDAAMFQAFYLTHMNTEERVIMPFLWEAMSNAEVFDIYMAIQASVSEQETLDTISAIFPYIDFAQALKLTRIFKDECADRYEDILSEIAKCLEPQVCQKLFQQAGEDYTKVSQLSVFAGPGSPGHEAKRVKKELEAETSDMGLSVSGPK